MRAQVQLILAALLTAISITIAPSAQGVVMANAMSDPPILVNEDEISGEAPSVETQIHKDVEESISGTGSANLQNDLKDEIPAPVVQLSVPDIVRLASEAYGLSPARMLQISWCETKHGTDLRSNFLGIFQFTWTTWNWSSIDAGFGVWDEERKMFLPNPNPYDPWINIWTAAWLAKNDGLKHWPNC